MPKDCRKSKPCFFRKLFYHSAGCEIFSRRLASDDVYPLHFLLFGSESIPPKSLGTTNPHNVVKATFHALLSLRQPEDVFRLRGVEPPQAGAAAVNSVRG